MFAGQLLEGFFHVPTIFGVGGAQQEKIFVLDSTLTM